MKRKHIFNLLIVGVIVFISIPAIHLVITHLNQVHVKAEIIKGYTNDASGLSLTEVDSIIDVPKSKVEITNQLKEILFFLKKALNLKYIPKSL